MAPQRSVVANILLGSMVLSGLPGSAVLAVSATYTFVDLSQKGCNFAPKAVYRGQVVGDRWQSGIYHPSIWSGSPASVVDLNPGNLTGCGVNAIWGSRQGGWGGGSTNSHAMLWSGSPDAAVDLHPADHFWSEVRGMGEGYQVGETKVPSDSMPHAAIWAGTAASFLDLHPTGFLFSEANDVHAGQQVGCAHTSSGSQRAMLWYGTAASAVNLHPAGYLQSYASAVWNGQQVGAGLRNAGSRALLWYGNAASVVDLTPSGYGIGAEALDVAGGIQVGHVWSGGNVDHAYAWSGSAASAIDLHTFLPATLVDSQATSIDELGNIVGTAHDSAGRLYAVMWVPTPEPTTLLLTLGPFGATLSRRRCAR